MAIHASSVEETFEIMKAKLGKLVPEFELKEKAKLVFEIEALKKKRDALILGHNYMEPVLFHTVPDVVGDSLELSRRAAATTKPVIVFCGVRFMAETAKILNPDRKVLLPALVAGCSLAASITADDVKNLRKKYPGVPVVTYINTYADVKAESDICCTSGNAARVVKSLNTDTVIFLPDEYLAKNVAEETGRTIIVSDGKTEKIIDPNSSSPMMPSPTMIGWHGRCEVHEKFEVDDITQARKQFPDVVVLSHPECSPEVVHASDFSASTSRMVDFVKQSKAKHFLILTECSMGDNIIAENPDKDILRMCSTRCPHMNEITLKDTLRALKEDVQEIHVPEEISKRARVALEKMLTL